MHPTSLPGPDGIGTLGANARAFADRLADAGQTWWQVLPLNTPGHGGSPYSAASAFAGNAMMVDLEPLVERGWLERAQVDAFRQTMAGLGQERVHYWELEQHKRAVLDQAWQRWANDDAGTRADFDAFVDAQAGWLDDYALFMVLKRHFGGGEWRGWPAEYVERDEQALAEARREHADAIEQVQFRQWLFFRQWQELRDYAGARDVKFIGDIPIFVAMDSADVWANRDMFQMDDDGNVDEVSGVPPDYFSKTGQKWGNPLYDWQAIARHTQNKRAFGWWLARVETVLQTVDLMRIDHFRGFEAYWAVPAEAETAVDGEWRDGPGDALFEAIKADLGEVPFIAEDLGMITDEVIELRDRHGLPGMKVLQFADWDDPDHIFLPENYEENFVAYTGTHDNDTTRGWYDQLDQMQRHKVRQYLSCSDDDVVWAMIEAVFDSVAALAIVPVQDIFELGTQARMNLPGGNGNNWTWRADGSIVEQGEAWSRLRKVTEEARRA